ncbi:site-specific recombinase XerD [Homoserinimonas aerilata]|uniref:Site-specific recombinase XerD n=1 Tax=Homoserinimonas aerilata TaxID=1162970 RepID=A0A542YL10_9MICO|nr:site-specific integrase [Homoserinimonas aerilata]TQL48775.1 site-specific recombinase XerD [Homoserinimonas aerilata]
MARSAARSRRRGVGSITSYSTKAGTRWRWQLRVPLNTEHPEDGERQAGKAGYLTAEAADDALQEARKKVKEHRTISREGPPTIGSYAQNWLDGLSLENSTVYGYRKIVRNHVTPYLGSIKLDQLTATRLARHYRELGETGRKDAHHVGEGLSANTVNKVHVVIGALLDAALDDGHLAVNPARKSRTVKAPTGKQIRAQRPEIVTWTAGELRAFLDWDRDVFQDELHALWHLVAHTGMRRGEALALRWGDLDLTGQRVSIRRAADSTMRNAAKSTKSGSSRVVDIDEETINVLRTWKARRGALSLDLARAGAYIFGNAAGEMRGPNEVGARWSYRVKRARLELGPDALKPLTIKGLRHTHATLLLELGVHPKVVQERLGHSQISTTMNIYSHVTPTMQKDAVARLAQLLS